MSSWPPPPTELAPWHTQRLTIAGRAVDARVREVFLWGQEVLIDETETAVWCSRCQRFVPAAEVARAPRGHHAFDNRPCRGVYVPSSCTPPRPPTPSAVDIDDDLEERQELDGLG